MYGLQAIDAANGWTITVLGISIVFSGLTILAMLIASMERFLNLWDRKREFFTSDKQLSHASESIPVQVLSTAEAYSSPISETDTVHLTPEQMEAATYFQLIIARLGEPFSLPHLLEQAEKRGVSKPHSHLDVFLKTGLIAECNGEQSGFYRWCKDIPFTLENPGTPGT